jgi:hypothetical protein
VAEVLVVRKESVVTLVPGKPQAPLVQQRGADSLIVQQIGAIILGGDAVAIEHDQTAPNATWTVNHNLGAKPSSISVLSDGGHEIEADVLHISDNQFQVYFSVPMTGFVRISP